MLTLNSAGADFGKLPYVSAMTDVTGFGLLGHLIEMCEGSGLSAEIELNKVPRFTFLDEYIQQKSMPGGTTRNWDSYGKKVNTISEEQKAVLADPQTSGGLLVCCSEEAVSEVMATFHRQGFSHACVIGRTIKGTPEIIVS